jgi:hypothetical protein
MSTATQSPTEIAALVGEADAAVRAFAYAQLEPERRAVKALRELYRALENGVDPGGALAIQSGHAALRTVESFLALFGNPDEIADAELDSSWPEEPDVRTDETTMRVDYFVSEWDDVKTIVELALDRAGAKAGDDQ